MIELSYTWMIILAVIVFTSGFLCGWSSHNKAIVRAVLLSCRSKRDVK